MVSFRQSRIRYANNGIEQTATSNENQNITPIIPRCFTPENSLRIMNNEAAQPVKTNALYASLDGLATIAWISV